jgi:tetratricopeptide (TPR) repeat protein
MSPEIAAHLETAHALEALANWEGAARAYEAALAEDPDLAEAQFCRGNALRHAGRVEEALAAYARAITLRPRWGAAHMNRGALLADSGRPAEAVGFYRAATRLEPGNDAAWSNLGNALSRLGRHAEAIAALQTATRLRPAGAIGHYNLGNAFAACGRTMQAAEALMRAVSLDPGFCAASIALAGQLRNLGLTEAARDASRLAVQAAPGLPQAWVALGSALADLGVFTEAEASHRKAQALDPENVPALVNLAQVRAAQGALHEALALFHAALARAPAMNQACNQASLGRATTLLALGDYERGWPAYRARDLPEAKPRVFAMPRWGGASLRGRKILVHAEQGFGDTLQFCRFVPRVAALGAEVFLEVQPPLQRLLACLPGISRVIPRGARLPRADLHVPLIDLAGIFASSLDDLAPAAPYILADSALIERHRLPHVPGALRVGLAWAAQSRRDLPNGAALDRRRSLKLAAFAPLAPLCRSGRLKLFSLMLDPPEAAPEGLDLQETLPKNTDFAETAAVVAQLDLVISVDTSVAHLAAAMGKKVWLLNRADPCWRWLRDRSDSPWYPSMTIFRQVQPNNWGEAITEIVRRLSG